MHRQQNSSAPKSVRSACSGIRAATIMVGLAACIPFALHGRTTRSDEPPPGARSELPPSKAPHPTSKPELLRAPFKKSAAQAAQAAWSRHLGQPATLTNSLGMKFVLVPPGEFQMGSGESAEATAQFVRAKGRDDFALDDARAPKFENEHPQHRVRITEPFYLGQYEVTVRDFRTFLAETNYKDPDEVDGWNWSETRKKGGEYEQEDEHPVVIVTWNEAKAFCDWLSKKEHARYRLPTETEWEYACRAGTTGRYQTGDDPEALAQVGDVADSRLKKVGLFNAWAINDGYDGPAPPGRFAPNPFGLYDMHGNACEWCGDSYGYGGYDASVVNNPQGPTEDLSRVIRGGSWWAYPWNCRSASRWWGPPTSRISGVGFRLARVP